MKDLENKKNNQPQAQLNKLSGNSLKINTTAKHLFWAAKKQSKAAGWLEVDDP